MFRDGQVRSVTLGQNGDAMPTTVYLTEDENFVVGDVARRRMTENPAGGAREFKRRLGDSTPLVLNGSPYSADRLMGVVFRHVIKVVTETEGEPPSFIIVSHPSNWKAFKVDLIRQAAEGAAGSATVGLIEEPIAAAVYYAHSGRIDVGELVGVYDLGGGTFDAAVLQRTQTGFRRLGEPTGIERLGGIDFDAALLTHVQHALGEQFAGLDTSDRAVRVGLEDLRLECIEAKQSLSADTSATINVGVPGLHDSVRITRGEFEQLIRPVLRETIESLRAAIRQAGATADQLATVLLIGGSSRIPLVSDIVSAEIGRPVAVDAHPKLAVAMGAAVATQSALDVATAVARPAGVGAAAAAVDEPRETSARSESPSRVGTELPWLKPAAIAAAAVLILAAGLFSARAFTGPDKPEPKPTAAKPFVEINDVTVDNGRYRVDYLVSGFTPKTGDSAGQMHIHLFLDTTEPENAGADGPQPGEWSMTDNLTSKLTDFTPGNRGSATRICAVVVDHKHAVVDPKSGNCSALPDGPTKPTYVPRPRATTPTPTATWTPTDTPTPTATWTQTPTPTAPVLDPGNGAG